MNRGDRARYLYAADRAERVIAPGRLDVYPHPEGNDALSYEADRRRASAWWGFILHARRTGKPGNAWELYEKETA